AIPRHHGPRVSHGRTHALLIRPTHGGRALPPARQIQDKEFLGDFMKSITGRSSLAAAALCAFALAACDSVKDVRTEPTIAGPTPTAVLQGQVTGLGYRRPVVLEDRGAARCADDNSAAIYCSEFFFGNFDNPESTFT